MCIGVCHWGGLWDVVVRKCTALKLVHLHQLCHPLVIPLLYFCIPSSFKILGPRHPAKKKKWSRGQLCVEWRWGEAAWFDNDVHILLFYLFDVFVSQFPPHMLRPHVLVSFLLALNAARTAFASHPLPAVPTRLPLTMALETHWKSLRSLCRPAICIFMCRFCVIEEREVANKTREMFHGLLFSRGWSRDISGTENIAESLKCYTSIFNLKSLW